MNGVDIVGALLRADPAMLAMIPVERQKAGALPDNIELSALLLRSVSLIDRQTLKRGTVVRSVERVAVTVRAANYRDQVAVMKRSRTVCGGFVGDIAGAWRVSILTAGTGPDLRGFGNSFEQTQDFRVSFDAPA